MSKTDEKTTETSWIQKACGIRLDDAIVARVILLKQGIAQ
jgi:hypothetical protein